MLGLAGIARKSIITSLNNQATTNLQEFVKAMSELKDGQRVPIRFYALSDINKEKVAVVQIDRRWHEFKMAIRNDLTGLWDYVKLPPCPGEAVYEPHTSSSIGLDENLGLARKVVTALVHVEYHLPFKVDGVCNQVSNGVGVVVDESKGFVVVDRHAVPTSIGDILLTFANSIIIPGELVYMHQIYNFAIIRYDTKLLGATPVTAAPISALRLHQGDTVTMVCLTKTFHPIIRKTAVTNVRQFHVSEPVPPTFRGMNVEGIELENPVSHGGVLVDESGDVQALWMAYSKSSSKGRYEFYMGMSIYFMRTQHPSYSARGSNTFNRCQNYTGFDIHLIIPVLKSLQINTIPTLRGLEVELTYAQIAHARVLGLSDDWVRKIESTHLTRRNVLIVRRLTSGTEVSQVLKEGDIVLAVDGVPATNYLDVLRHHDREILDLVRIALHLATMRSRKFIKVRKLTIDRRYF